MSTPQIRADWAQHIVYGAAVGAAAAASMAVAGLVTGAPGLRFMEPVAAVTAALVAGLAKELADWVANRRTPGAHEVALSDVVATTLGGLAVAVPGLIWLWR